MNSQDMLHVTAGVFILASTLLGIYVDPWWFALTLFVGANLFQFGFSKWCLMQKIYQKLGFK